MSADLVMAYKTQLTMPDFFPPVPSLESRNKYTRDLEPVNSPAAELSEEVFRNVKQRPSMPVSSEEEWNEYSFFVDGSVVRVEESESR